MLAYRLVRLIETHSDALAGSLLKKVQESDCTQGYRNVPPEELNLNADILKKFNADFDGNVAKANKNWPDLVKKNGK